MICFRIKKHKAERDVPHLLLIMTPAQVTEAGLIPAILSLLRRGKNKNKKKQSLFYILDMD